MSYMQMQERFYELLAFRPPTLLRMQVVTKMNNKLSKVHFGNNDSLHMSIVAQKRVSRSRAGGMTGTWLSIVVMKFHDTVMVVALGW